MPCLQTVQQANPLSQVDRRRLMTRRGAALMAAALGAFLAGCPDLEALRQQAAPPVITARIQPTRGPTIGGVEVAITGEKFQPGTQVLFGAFRGGNVNLESATVLRATTPPQGAGVVDVNIIAPDGSSTRIPAGYEYVAVAAADAEIIQQIEQRFPGSPKLVSAVALSNTQVLVTFNEPVGRGANDPTHFGIVHEEVNQEVGILLVRSAEPGTDQSTVLLTTFSQNDLLYRLTVTDIQDMAGNPIAPPEILDNWAQTNFPGLAPPAHIDTDGDGLTDSAEQRGWQVTVRLTNGPSTQRGVTSSPTSADTDGDGLDDRLEKNIASDPRSGDTDADEVPDAEEWNEWLSDPLDQDTDGDSFADSVDLYFRTSPTLADTDGDQLDDAEEIIERNRNPRRSDLPIPQVRVGEVSLTLDERFTYTDSRGQQQTSDRMSSASFTQGTSQTYSTSDTATIETSLKLGFKLGGEYGSTGGKVTGEASTEGQVTAGYTTSVSRQSSESAQEQYQDSISDSLAFSENQAVTRTTEGAAVSVDVTITNAGDLAFTISNLEITMLEQDPQQRDRFIPVASLIAAGVGNPINLGPFQGERGPFIFDNTQIFPSRVLDLLREPRGLVFKVANFDITDEIGRNFAFTSQEVADRTAGVIIDYGNGDKEAHRIATASRFDEQGITRGITLREALSVVGITGTPGADTPLPAGANLSHPSIHDTYGTVINADGVEDLTRVRGVQHDLAHADNPETRFWVVISPDEIPADTNFSETVLRPGRTYTLAYVQDIDRDGLFAPEEFLSGTSDRNADTDGDGIGDFDEIRTGWVVVIPGNEYRAYPDPIRADSDNDGVSDAAERDLKSDPRKRDSDEDGLADKQECCDGYEVVLFDGDDDPSNNPVEQIVPYTDRAIIDGGNGVVNTAAAPGSDDEQAVAVGAPVAAGSIVVLPGPDGRLATEPTGDDRVSVGQKLMAGRDGVVDTQASGDDVQVIALGQVADPDAIAITAGLNGVIDAPPQGDDRVRAAHDRLVASDPVGRDTDADGLFDGREELLGSNPNIVGDAGTVLDTDLDGLKDAEETNGWNVLVTDVNGQVTTRRVSSDPLLPDTDRDGLPDLLESLLRSDATMRDTDGDTLSDLLEYDPADPGGFYDPFLFDEFSDRCADAPQCSYQRPNAPVATHPDRADTDEDLLGDGAELTGWDVAVEGEPTIHVTSNPLLADADNDGWNDRIERIYLTNPNDADTDGDDVNDRRETEHNSEPDRVYGSRSPLIKDQLLRLRFVRITMVNNCTILPGGSLFGFQYGVRTPDSVFRSIVDQNNAPVPDCNFCDSILADTPCSCDDRCPPGWPGMLVADDDQVPLNRAASFVKQYTQTARIVTTTRQNDGILCNEGERLASDRELVGAVTPITNGSFSINQGNCQFSIDYTVTVVE